MFTLVLCNTETKMIVYTIEQNHIVSYNLYHESQYNILTTMIKIYMFTLLTNQNYFIKDGSILKIA